MSGQDGLTQPTFVSTEDATAALWAALTDVHDPEIPTLSVVDLGMVNDVLVVDGTVTVSLTPTFLGCPATEIIRRNVERRLATAPGVLQVTVKFVFDPPWTSERITPQGREHLREFGIAPPACHLFQVGKSLTAACPYCGSDDTRMENMFGPTACRSVFYCNQCHQPFEAMKPV